MSIRCSALGYASPQRASVISLMKPHKAMSQTPSLAVTSPRNGLRCQCAFPAPRLGYGFAHQFNAPGITSRARTRSAACLNFLVHTRCSFALILCLPMHAGPHHGYDRLQVPRHTSGCCRYQCSSDCRMELRCELHIPHITCQASPFTDPALLGFLAGAVVCAWLPNSLTCPAQHEKAPLARPTLCHCTSCLSPAPLNRYGNVSEGGVHA